MKELSFYQDIPKLSVEFLETLKVNDRFDFIPTREHSTKIGKKINLGYNCYAIKLYKISNSWDNITVNKKKAWTDFILDYQNHDVDQFNNYFIDKEVFRYFNNPLTVYRTKDNIKKIVKKLSHKDFQLRDIHIFKTLNAENKQTISTLKEVGVEILNVPIVTFDKSKDLESYLNLFDWSKPWDAGAQFSIYSVYSEVYDLNLKNELIKFIETKLDFETGSYFEGRISTPRQIINGAMKVISGLDWLENPIHFPKKLIDFCLNNRPEFEGCDLVDYVYVLYKCSLQTDYKRDEINSLLTEVLDYLKLLYFKEEKGFSYFKNKSQTHYYGINISKGKNLPDIHGTLLSVWAIVMILEVLEKNTNNYNILRP